MLKNPEQILQVASSGNFYRVLSVEEYEERLYDFLGAGHGGVPSGVELARFRRRQLLRIALRDVQGVAGLAEITEELSSMADAILSVVYRHLRDDFVMRHGEPRLADGSPCGFSVIALGKLGGQELNYSSDIDLMFIYGGNGHTDGPDVVTNKEFYKKVANQYTQLLSTYTAEGQCYRVDLRLRPDGTLGEVAISGEGAREYYSGRARDWEKQMLIKARVAAGEPEPGAALLEFVEPLIYQTSLDFRAVEAVSETRQRISEKMAGRRHSGGIDIKLTPGGIRDIEFLVQCLQRLHGGRETWVRHGGTMFALFRLRDKGLLSGAEYARLASAYQFLRYLEHRLQMEDDRQTHTLPADPEALGLLARKMPPAATGEALDSDSLVRSLDDHLAAVREIYERVIHAQKPLYYTPGFEPALEEEPEPPPVATNLTRFLDQRAPGLAAVVAAGRPASRAGALRTFPGKGVCATGDFGAPGRRRAPGGRRARCVRTQRAFRRRAAALPRADGGNRRALPAGGRRAVRRRLAAPLSIAARCCASRRESLLEAPPIFATLGKTSVLADSVIAAAYQIAVRDAPPPASHAYEPSNQMMVIALGRLGMREFDLGSDADLVFVIPDQDAPEHAFWTDVAERTVQILSAYTGEGVMFAVDTRLRPNGREGDLVRSEGAYKAYFEGHAEAWEGIAYMKSRAVAGNVERATEFLNELQQVDWRRYGQSMRSRKELAEMRARLEREQGPRNPLKAGRGGFYDIDFALMYLRLRGAGIFYKVLNTPERIDVIEKMGHLDREDADFLREAATFYRGIDHGQRVSRGHAEGSLPTSHAQMEVLASLVKRWTPEHLHQQRLDVTLREIRRRTREYFNRLFERS